MFFLVVFVIDVEYRFSFSRVIFVHSQLQLLSHSMAIYKVVRAPRMNVQNAKQGCGRSYRGMSRAFNLIAKILSVFQLNKWC